VVRSGGPCKHHIHCPQLEVCLKKRCQRQPCKKYKDCAEINSNLMCHPEGFCSGKLVLSFLLFFFFFKCTLPPDTMAGFDLTVVKRLDSIESTK
jgi:hypothetical protein